MTVLAPIVSRRGSNVDGKSFSATTADNNFDVKVVATDGVGNETEQIFEISIQDVSTPTVVAVSTADGAANAVDTSAAGTTAAEAEATQARTATWTNWRFTKVIKEKFFSEKGENRNQKRKLTKDFMFSLTCYYCESATGELVTVRPFISPATLATDRAGQCRAALTCF